MLHKTKIIVQHFYFLSTKRAKKRKNFLLSKENFVLLETD